MKNDFDYISAMRKAEEKAKSLGLSHKDSFTGTHRSISFKIARHNNYDLRIGEEMRWDHSTWCYYIYLREQNFLAEDWSNVFEKEPETYDRSNGEKMVCRRSGWLDSCDFHGGITWFRAQCDPAQPQQTILEIGCDYAHLWDQECGYDYDVESVLRDVKHTIEKLHEIFSVQVWSRIDGTYHPEAEIEAYNLEAHKRLWPAEAA